jgi:hypothetical protein
LQTGDIQRNGKIPIPNGERAFFVNPFIMGIVPGYKAFSVNHEDHILFQTMNYELSEIM